MPQLVLPIFPQEATHITAELSFEKRDGWVTYFHGMLPVFRHSEDDIQSFRMITSQLCVTGSAKQVEIIKAFGVSLCSVKRAVKLYREKGPAGFFATTITRSRRPHAANPRPSPGKARLRSRARIAGECSTSHPTD